MEQFAETGREGRFHCILGWSFYLRAYLHFQRNEMETAREYFLHAVENRYVLHARAAIDCLGAMAMTWQSLGESEKAEKIKDMLLEYALQTGDPAYLTIARAFSTRLSLWSGQWDPAPSGQDASDWITDDMGIMFFWLEDPRLTWVKTWGDENHP